MEESKENLPEAEVPLVKVTPVTKLQSEYASDTPLSSGGEDDDAKDFFETLKEDATWRVPPKDLEEKIRTLLEHYFSDANLTKDKFLLKHVKRNKLGYVSVKLLTSFKKLKNLSKSDWRITAYCLSQSKVLELNKSGTKVRRKEPLPDIDLPTSSIKTLLYKLPDGMEEPTIDGVSEQFRSFGELTTVRIIRPGKEVPVDLRNHTTKHPELGVQTCVVVEFESTDATHNAYKTLSKQARDDNKPDMYSLLGSGRNPRKQLPHSKRDNDSADESPYLSSKENSPMVRRKFMNGRSNMRHSTSPLVSPQGSRNTSPERNNIAESKSPKQSPKMSRKSASNHSTPSSSPWFPRKQSRENTPEGRGSPLSNRKQVTHPAHTTSPLAINNNLLSPGESVSGSSTPASGSSPWLQRRRQFVASQGNSPSSTPGSSPMLGRKFQDGVPVGVSRLPRGPPNQTSKGFEVTPKRFSKADKMLNALSEEVTEVTIVN
uniref:la-related protein 6 isoform X1 n=1 Tax=Ciona intestinalis TaxID=7719 RepID=UPI00005214B6|nr:la-related protein 6 isoform X1 [Ciona intestinalis]|eukprot:XP_002130806.2 la-related protein 6 isoform X1 [Ciona intestinalis]